MLLLLNFLILNASSFSDHRNPGQRALDALADSMGMSRAPEKPVNARSNSRPTRTPINFDLADRLLQTRPQTLVQRSIVSVRINYPNKPTIQNFSYTATRADPSFQEILDNCSIRDMFSDDLRRSKGTTGNLFEISAEKDEQVYGPFRIQTKKLFMDGKWRPAIITENDKYYLI